VGWLYYLQFLSVLNLLVYRTMYDNLKNLMPVNQLGFMKNRSTVTNLLKYALFVMSSIEEGWQVVSVYTDFSKAFERSSTPSTVTGGDVSGYQTCSRLMAKVLFDRENSNG
jgi:hypothetical protein